MLELSKHTTGIKDLDLLLDGGLRRGRIHEIYGSSDSAKTTLSYYLIKSEQEKGNIVAYIDTAKNFKSNYPKEIGIDLNQLILLRPGSIEFTVETIKELIDNGVSLVIIDETVSLFSENEDINIYKENKKGLGPPFARIIPELESICRRTGSTIIFTNQLRVSRKCKGTEISTTTRALLYYLDTRIRLYLGSPIRYGGIHIGRYYKAKLIKGGKNKSFSKFKLYFNKGIV
jgi:recombination protein RecA